MALDQFAKPPMAQEPAAPAGAPAPQAGGQKQASDMEKLDLEIAVKMGTKLLREAGGLQTIEKAMKSSGDPVQVISKFLVQLILQIKEAVQSQGVELSPNIVLGQGGWVQQMLDVIEGELGLPPEFSDQVFGDVVETFKALSKGGQQAPPAAQGGAPAPQAAGPGTQAPAGQPIMGPGGMA